MSALARIDVDKLARTLGMLGSDHPGEVVAAARAAERLRQRAGLQWHDLLLREGPAQPPGSRPDPADWRALVARCAACDRLSAWERSFLAVLSSYAGTPSLRQMQILAGIAAKAGA